MWAQKTNGNRKISHIKSWRYIYILNVISRDGKSRYFGKRSVYYIGQTLNLTKRVKEHVNQVGSNFLKSYFPNSQKNLVFVDYIYGSEYDAMEYEYRLKRMNRVQKSKKIESNDNQLIRYLPMKAIILKKNNRKDEQICLKM